jgi:hypothetical protein
MSSVLAGGTGSEGATPSSPPSRPPDAPAPEASRSRNTALTAIAGVGVLLLAMGVGVLIGRAGVGKQSSPPTVITVGGGSGASPSTGASEAAFSSDWPAGTTGFTVQLQTLPAGSTVAAVGAAKAAATAKGAPSVGALKAEEFSSLTSSGYVIYSGVYHTRAAAAKALAGVKKNFPSASVQEVSSKASGAGASSSGGGGATSSGAGSNISHPAPPAALNGLKNAKGKSYEEKSKNLPDVVSTG